MQGKKIAVIGGGFAGVAIAAALVRAAVDAQEENFTITLFEPHTIGPGVAYDTDAPESFILNHELDFMGSVNVRLDHTDPQDFYRWVQQRRSQMETEYPKYDFSNPKEYVPRKVFGTYLRSRYAELKAYAELHDIQIIEKHCKVERIRRLTGGHTGRFSIEVDSTQQAFDTVVLTTGTYFNCINPELIQTGKYFQPYEYKAYMSSDIPDNSVMLIVGAALSAYDAAIYALESGKYHKVIMASRRGMLRKVRGITQPYKRKYLTVENLSTMAGGPGKPVPLDLLLKAVRQEMTRAYGQQVSWKTGYTVSEIVHLLRRDIAEVQRDKPLLWRSVHSSLTDDERHELYALLSDEDKRTFATEYGSLYQLFSAPMPLCNATKIEDYLATGQLVLVNGADKVTYDTSTHNFYLHTAHNSDGTPVSFNREADKQQTAVYPESADVCVDASGLGRNIQHIPLYADMMALGLAAPHPAGGIKTDIATRLVIDAQGQPVDGLYALGHMSCGETVLPHNSLQISRPCNVLGPRIIQSCTAQSRVSSGQRELSTV